jgi:hypothetical protein
MRFPDLQALMQYHDKAIVCLQETHLCPVHSLNFYGFTAYFYDHLIGNRADSEPAIFFKDCMYYTAITLQTPLQASAVHLTFTSLSLTLSNIYLPSAFPIDRGKVRYLLSLLLPPFILLWDFNSKNIPWG